ncbi:hypothetical protein BGW42_005458 [Actinomortierella wolfii]|nr:hypothetical protein BGW42_005458 [Actinomortierella wolfii]
MPPLNKRKKATARKPRKNGKFMRESEEDTSHAVNAIDDRVEEDLDAIGTDTKVQSDVVTVKEELGLSITFLMSQGRRVESRTSRSIRGDSRATFFRHQRKARDLQDEGRLNHRNLFAYGFSSESSSILGSDLELKNQATDASQGLQGHLCDSLGINGVQATTGDVSSICEVEADIEAPVDRSKGAC